MNNKHFIFQDVFFFISGIKSKSEITSSIFYVCFIINDLTMVVGMGITQSDYSRETHYILSDSLKTMNYES